MLKTAVIATAAINPEKVNEIYQDLMHEIFPIIKEEEKERLNKMSDALKEEVGKMYVVQKQNTPVLKTKKNRRRKYRRNA